MGPYYEQVQQVKGLTKEGGWLVMLGSLGQCADYEKVFGQGLNVVLRAYNAGQKFDNAQADAWVATLGALDTKGQKVYFMPWNEPNHPNEGGGDKAGAETYAYVAYLKDQLGRAGILNSKVILLSPMVNKTNGNYEGFFNNPNGKDGYYGITSGSSINEYDFPPSFPTDVYPQACQQGNAYMNNCQYASVVPPAPSLPGNADSGGYFSLEAGVAGTDPSYPRYKDNEIRTMLNGSWGNWSRDGAFNMFAIFSYDPHRPGDWEIYSAPQTTSFYKSTCTVGTVQDGATVSQTDLNNWMTAKKDELIECASGCGYAPKNRPDLCDAAGRSDPYDLSIYDEYDADPDKFYVHPIKGLEVPYDDRDRNIIRADLVNQGYEAHCATPQFKIKLNQKGEEWMETLLADRNLPANGGTTGLDVRPGGIVFGGDLILKEESSAQGDKERGHEDLPYRSVLTVDYRNTLMPVFRDVTGKRWLTTSLEEYFGFSDIKIGDQSLAEINSAPINSLLSRQKYCAQALAILTKQEQMCQKIQDGDVNCALYQRPIPETAYTVKTLLDDYKPIFDSKLEDYKIYEEDEDGNRTYFTYNQQKGLDKFCQGMISQNNLDEDFMTAVKNTPLNIDRAYRLAFLVTEIEMLYPSANNMFNLFEHPNAGFMGGVKNPQDAVLVTAFKVPDFGTNKGGADRLDETIANATAGNVFWADSAWLTRNSLMTQAEQIKSEATASAKRARLLAEGGAMSKDDEIHCTLGKVGAPECNDPLSRAVIDVVNASARLSQKATANTPDATQLQELGFDQFQAECPTLDKEVSTQISDPATLQPVKDASKVYTTEFGAELLDKLFKDSTHEIDKKRSEKDPSFAETWRDRPPFLTYSGGNISYGDEDDPDDEVINKWGGLRDWGLKTVFHVVNETLAKKFPNDCCKDMRKVKHYLVYPMGYDLQSVQTVLAGSFFTTDELISLAEAAEDYDRIQVSGDIVKFEGAKKDVTFQDRSFYSDAPIFNAHNWPVDADVTICDGEGTPALDGCTVVANKLDIVGKCTEVRANRRLNPGQNPPEVRNVLVGWKLPCTRSFGWEVETDGDTLSAGILGGKLGFYLREIQKTLNTKASDARQYLDTCKTIEQFLRGQCGSGEGLVPTPTPDDCTWASCGGWLPPQEPPIGPVQPEPGCADHPCFTMCATRNSTGTVTVDFSWKFNSGCFCNDLSDHELIIGGVSQGRPSCINVISSSVSNRSCSYDNQPENVSICRKKGNYNASSMNEDSCRLQNDMEICVNPIQE